MSTIDVPLKNGGFGSTRRNDNWWIEPILVFLGYMAFIVYATWAALQGNNYLVHHPVRRSGLFVADVFAAADSRKRQPGGRRFCRSRRRC